MQVRSRLLALAVAACGCIVAAAAASPACLIVPPPDMPLPPPHRPTILHDAVSPRKDGPYSQWPSDNTFTVLVQLDDPSQMFLYAVFIDYDPLSPTNSQPYPLTTGGGATAVSASPAALDGGIMRVSASIGPQTSTTCRRHVELIVAHGFFANAPHTPDTVGGDSVDWYFMCPEYDAWTALDGGFPDEPIVPDVGVDE